MERNTAREQLADTGVQERQDWALANALIDDYIREMMSNKVVRAKILNAVIAEYNDSKEYEIVQKYLDDSVEFSKKTIRKKMVDQVYYEMSFLAKMPKGNGFVKVVIIIDVHNNSCLGYHGEGPVVTDMSMILSRRSVEEALCRDLNDANRVYSIWLTTNPPGGRKTKVTSYTFTKDPSMGSSKFPFDLTNMVVIGLRGEEGMSAWSILMEDYATTQMIRVLHTVFFMDRTLAETKVFFKAQGIHLEAKTEDALETIHGIVEKYYAREMAALKERDAYKAMVDKAVVSMIKEGQALSMIQRNLGMKEEDILLIAREHNLKVKELDYPVALVYSI